MKYFTSRSNKLHLVFFVFLFLSISCAVNAAGSTSIMLSSTSTTVGNKVTVTVTGSESSKLSLRYNNEVLKFTNCSAAGFSTEGNVVSFNGKSAQVTFEATDPGSGDLVVSSDTLAGSSASVQVAAPQSSQTDTKKEDEEEKEKEKSDSDKNSSKSKEDGDFVIDGKAYVLSERFTDSEIPEGFTKKQMKIHGGTYRELVNDKLTLVYLKPADNIQGSGEFYIYDQDNDSVSPFMMLGKGDYYMIPSEPDDVPQTLVDAKLKTKGEKIKAYQYGDDESDFYYVFGTDSEGDKGWFSYDSRDNTIQRANSALLEQTAAPLEEDEDAKKGNGKKKKDSGFSLSFLDSLDFSDITKNFKSSRTVLAAVIFVGVVLLIIILDILLFRRKISDDDEYYDDDYDDDENYDDDNDGGRKPAGNNNPEVLQAGKLLEADDFEEANKPPRSRKALNKQKSKSSDIWDTSEGRLSDTAEMPLANDDSRKLKKQVFRGRSTDSGLDGDDNKIDLIDLNDL